MSLFEFDKIIKQKYKFYKKTKNFFEYKKETLKKFYKCFKNYYENINEDYINLIINDKNNHIIFYCMDNEFNKLKENRKKRKKMEPECYVCLGAGPGPESASGPVACGCACRGTAGAAHVECMLARAVCTGGACAAAAAQRARGH